MVQAVINHTQETCLRLALVQDRCFGRTRKIIRVVLASIPIIIGFFVGYDNVWGILLKEWKGCSQKTIVVLITGIVVLIISTFIPELLK